MLAPARFVNRVLMVAGRKTAICCLMLTALGILAPAAPAKNATQPKTQPKTQQQLMNMLDEFEKTPVKNTRNPNLHRLPPARRMPSSAIRPRMPMQSMQQGLGAMPQGMGGQPAMMQMLQQRMQGSGGGQGAPAMMQMLQQRMQGSGGGQGAPAFMQMLQQRMPAKGGQATGGAPPQFMQMLQQPKQSTNPGMSGAPPGGLGAMKMPGRGTLMQRAGITPKSQGSSSGAMKGAQPRSAPANQSQDLESLMESQYGQ